MNPTRARRRGTAGRAQRAAADPAIVSDAAALHARYTELDAARVEVERLYARWAELESKADPARS